MSGLALPASLAALTRCAGEESRYSMAGVQLTDPGGGQYRATVTDGRRLIHVQGYCPETKTEPAGELGCPPDVPVMVPRDAWDTIFRFAPKLIGYERNSYGEKTAPVRVARLSDGRVLLSSKDRTLTTDQLDGHFPDWRQVMPKKNPIAVVSVNPKLLAETLTALAAMLGDEFQRVTLCYFGPNTAIGLVAKNSAACIDALLMPLDEPTPPAKPQKMESQNSVEETVEAWFTNDPDWPYEILVEEDTDQIMEEVDVPWGRGVIKAAVEAFKAKQPPEEQEDRVTVGPPETEKPPAQEEE
jgi:hypothetical protein